MSLKKPLKGLEVLCPRKAWTHMAGMRCAMYQESDHCGAGCGQKVPDDVAKMLYALRYREVALERARLEADQAVREAEAEARRDRFASLRSHRSTRIPMEELQ